MRLSVSMAVITIMTMTVMQGVFGATKIAKLVYSAYKDRNPTLFTNIFKVDDASQRYALACDFETFCDIPEPRPSPFLLPTTDSAKRPPLWEQSRCPFKILHMETSNFARLRVKHSEGIQKDKVTDLKCLHDTLTQIMLMFHVVRRHLCSTDEHLRLLASTFRAFMASNRGVMQTFEFMVMMSRRGGTLEGRLGGGKEVELSVEIKIDEDKYYQAVKTTSNSPATVDQLPVDILFQSDPEQTRSVLLKVNKIKSMIGECDSLKSLQMTFYGFASDGSRLKFYPFLNRQFLGASHNRFNPIPHAILYSKCASQSLLFACIDPPLPRHSYYWDRNLPERVTISTDPSCNARMYLQANDGHVIPPCYTKLLLKVQRYLGELRVFDFLFEFECFQQSLKSVILINYEQFTVNRPVKEAAEKRLCVVKALDSLPDDSLLPRMFKQEMASHSHHSPKCHLTMAQHRMYPLIVNYTKLSSDTYNQFKEINLQLLFFADHFAKNHNKMAMDCFAALKQECKRLLRVKNTYGEPDPLITHQMYYFDALLKQTNHTNVDLLLL